MKIFKFILVSLASFIFYSCNTTKFSSLSKYNEFDKSQRYLLFKNDSVGIQSSTFWDFTFPLSNKEVKKIRKGKIPFRNILLYAHTVDPTYEYYIILNNEKSNNLEKEYLRKDTILDGQKISLIATKNIPKSDWNFIMNNIHFKSNSKIK